MLILGTRQFGAVDRVPGLFHVATDFIHLYYFPVLPLRSILIIEENSSKERLGLPYGFSFKSVVMGWMRGLLVVAFLAVGAVLAVTLIDLAKSPPAFRGKLWPLVLELGLAQLCVIGVYWLTLWVGRARYGRAVELGKRLELEEVVIARYFAARGWHVPAALGDDSPSSMELGNFATAVDAEADSPFLREFRRHV